MLWTSGRVKHSALLSLRANSIPTEGGHAIRSTRLPTAPSWRQGIPRSRGFQPRRERGRRTSDDGGGAHYIPEPTVSLSLTGSATPRPQWSQLAPNAGVLEIEMSTFFALIGANVGGWIGWVVGAHVGLMTACMLSAVGTALGVYGGRRVASSLLD